MGPCIISFSSRADGNCSRIGKLILSLSGEASFFDFSEFEIHPCGKCGCECFAPHGRCLYMDDMEYRLLDAVTHSSRTWFVLPNYCDWPCANFFAFNERSQCYFQNRPDLLAAYEKVPKHVVVVSNTNESNFRQVLAYQSEEMPEMLFLSAKKYGKKSISGDLLDSEEAVKDIIAFVRRHQCG